MGYCLSASDKYQPHIKGCTLAGIQISIDIDHIIHLVILKKVAKENPVFTCLYAAFVVRRNAHR